MKFKSFFVLMLAVSLIGLASAGGYNHYYDSDYNLHYDDSHHNYKDYTYKEKFTETQYHPKNDYVTTRTTYFNYDNHKRLSTYDYRHGYSYRKTLDYRDRRINSKRNDDYSIRHLADKRYDQRKYMSDGHHKYDSDYDRYDNSYHKSHHYGQKDYYTSYSPHMKSYTKTNCYNYPPAGKLFYIACP